jgi:hypothetical protein
MNSKFIEISSGRDSRPTRFEIVEIEKNNFMLKTKDSYIGLLGTLQKFLQKNLFMTESTYTDMLWEHSSSMIKEAYKADNFFIAGEGK